MFNREKGWGLEVGDQSYALLLGGAGSKGALRSLAHVTGITKINHVRLLHSTVSYTYRSLYVDRVGGRI